MLMLSLVSWGQARKKVQHYIFDVNVGFKSLMYPGIKTFETNTVYDSNGFFNSIYTQESWETDYNFSSSYGLQGGLGLNLIMKVSYQLSLAGTIGIGGYNNVGRSVRVSNNGILSSYANTYYSDEFINTESSGYFEQEGKEYLGQVVLRNEIRILNNFWIGPQVGWQYINRSSDRPENIIGYVPSYNERGLYNLSTHQLFVGIRLAQKISQFSFDLSFSQAFLTTDKIKSIETYATDAPEKSPSSMNLDYRFPIIVDFTVGFSFFQQKNGCSTCPNW